METNTKKNYTDRPSFIAFILNGLLLGLGLLIFLFNYKSFDNKELLTLVLLGSIAVGVHSMLHFREEKEYGFNPLKKLLY
jgi:uncharacterized membrane-anchored protein YitT (DUF2179 family)